MKKLTRQKPHMLKGLYDWMLENELTPLIGVVSDYPRNIMPDWIKKEGLIILNISDLALNNLSIGQEIISLEATVGGEYVYLEFYTEAIAFIKAEEDSSIAFEFDVLNYEEYIENYKVTKRHIKRHIKSFLIITDFLPIFHDFSRFFHFYV